MALVGEAGRMTKEQRAALLRQKYFASRPKQPAKPIVKKYRWLNPGPLNRGLDWQGRFGVQLVYRDPKWVSEPEPVAPAITPQTRRTARQSALTRIAEQLPAKLPRVLF